MPWLLGMKKRLAAGDPMGRVVQEDMYLSVVYLAALAERLARASAA